MGYRVKDILDQLTTFYPFAHQNLEGKTIHCKSLLLKEIQEYQCKMKVPFHHQQIALYPSRHLAFSKHRMWWRQWFPDPLIFPLETMNWISHFIATCFVLFFTMYITAFIVFHFTQGKSHVTLFISNWLLLEVDCYLCLITVVCGFPCFILTKINELMN